MEYMHACCLHPLGTLPIPVVTGASFGPRTQVNLLCSYEVFSHTPGQGRLPSQPALYLSYGSGLSLPRPSGETHGLGHREQLVLTPGPGR